MRDLLKNSRRNHNFSQTENLGTSCAARSGSAMSSFWERAQTSKATQNKTSNSFSGMKRFQGTMQAGCPGGASYVAFPE